MFAGGAGIAPFRSFWEARAHREGCGRNLLFFGVQTRHTFLYEKEIRHQVRNGNLEAHIAFSRDHNGLVYDRNAKDLVEKRTEQRYIDSAILDEGADLCNIIMPTEMGGLGGYIYICGSASLYETVSRALLKVLSTFTTNGEGLLARAFVERRVMLDVFIAPRPMSISQPVITLAELARNTGHTENGRVWIGVHGCVYDVTDFLPVHPGGRLIVAASAGLDATHTFDLVAHTNNGEVQSLLSKYFIGHLAPRPHNLTKEIADLWDSWAGYLRTCVESLTTLSLEANSIQDGQAWFTNGRLDMRAVRKFYQFQSRFMKSSIPALFGPMYLTS
jgi:cytochrome b involved in lipid metabolism